MIVLLELGQLVPPGVPELRESGEYHSRLSLLFKYVRAATQREGHQQMDCRTRG